MLKKESLRYVRAEAELYAAKNLREEKEKPLSLVTPLGCPVVRVTE